MKKKFLLLLAVSSIVFAFKVASFYTKEKVKKLANETANRSCAWYYQYKVPRPVNLAELLYSNIHSNVDDSNQLAGQSTPQSYKNGWRLTMVNHPEYLHQGLLLYGKYFMSEYKTSIENHYKELLSTNASWRFPPPWTEDTTEDSVYVVIHIETTTSLGTNHIPRSMATEEEKQLSVRQKKERFQAHLVRWHEDSVRFAKELSTFSLANYWKEQKAIFSNYRVLVKKLLLLPSDTLNSYIKLAGDEFNYEGMMPLLKWLQKEKFIPIIPKSYSDDATWNTWHCWYFPDDLLLLTFRVNRDYPQWSPKKFLMEVDKISAEAENLIPTN